jgi:hypothetical protein
LKVNENIIPMVMAVVLVTLLPFSHAHYLFYNQTNCNKNSLQTNKWFLIKKENIIDLIPYKKGLFASTSDQTSYYEHVGLTYFWAHVNNLYNIN